jgi:hypothetical protein
VNHVGVCGHNMGEGLVGDVRRVPANGERIKTSGLEGGE